MGRLGNGGVVAANRSIAVGAEITNSRAVPMVGIEAAPRPDWGPRERYWRPSAKRCT
jgi:hypothetical protein